MLPRAMVLSRWSWARGRGFLCSVERLPNAAQKSVGGERLLQKGGLLRCPFRRELGFVRISRHVEHSYRWLERGRLAGQITAVHIGHDEIGHEQVDRLRTFTADPQGLSAVCSRQDLVSIGLKHSAFKAANLFLVIDYQDRFRAA